MKLTYSPRARRNIREIHDWFAGRSAKAAKAVVNAIRNTAELIGEYQKIGRATDIEGVRVLPVVKYPYLVYYMIRTDEVVIAHIRHGARDVPQPGDI